MKRTSLILISLLALELFFSSLHPCHHGPESDHGTGGLHQTQDHQALHQGPGHTNPTHSGDHAMASHHQHSHGYGHFHALCPCLCLCHLPVIQHNQGTGTWRLPGEEMLPVISCDRLHDGFQKLPLKPPRV